MDGAVIHFLRSGSWLNGHADRFFRLDSGVYEGCGQQLSAAQPSQRQHVDVPSGPAWRGLLSMILICAWGEGSAIPNVLLQI